MSITYYKPSLFTGLSIVVGVLPFFLLRRLITKTMKQQKQPNEHRRQIIIHIDVIIQNATK